ncbi:Laccase domain protein yfiH [Dermatophilus congolensis]|uniref:Laccase domain protein yfiH n=2 Tax=Dermatophilus congolensis TaxID=1863 RepID=A0AA46BLZ4_9MICO|nr:Laccase domain protein yfiH [Dermatophilus congolensis]
MLYACGVLPMDHRLGDDEHRVAWGFTDAGGHLPESGLEGPAYGEFNVGGHVGDDLARVMANRVALAREMGAGPGGVVFMNQVHGNDVAVVDGPWGQRPVADVDALVTTRPGLGLGVLVADCVPVVFADVRAGVVGVAHAGRRGMLSGVATRTVTVMRELGAERVVAWIGPSICGECYEVPVELAREAELVRPGVRSRTRWGSAGIDVVAGVEMELRAAEVEVNRISGCTLEDSSLYSFRRHKVTGRFAGVVVLDPAV